jgi:hypothetical protein
MSVGQAMPVGSSRALRLDPLALPLRFEARDCAADGRVRVIDLYHERVIVRRAVRGMRMAVNLRISAFRGVAIRLLPPDGDELGAVAIILEHHDPALSLPLHVTSDCAEVVAQWQAWARILNRPLLVSDAFGAFGDPMPRVGPLEIGEPAPRRRRHSAIKKRRPKALMRRKLPWCVGEPTVHSGEHEIIARN